jgi:hypothetical protein
MSSSGVRVQQLKGKNTIGHIISKEGADETRAGTWLITVHVIAFPAAAMSGP